MKEHEDDSRRSEEPSFAGAPATTDSTDATGDTSTSITRSGQSRRELLKSTGALGLGGLLGTGATVARVGRASAGSAAESWTLVAIPDTQVHAMYNSEPDRRLSYTESMVEWIVNNAEKENIAFVSHMGDMVQEGDDRRQFERIDSALSPLDDTVPWSPNVGNHDYHNTGYNGSTENFREFFGQSRFEDKDWFGGAGPKGNCFYQYFSAGGYDFLHLSLEYFPEGTREPENSELPIGWANDVLDEHPDMPTIVTTHFYLSTPEHDVAGIGNEIRDSLVKPNPQVFMVLNGHHTTENHHVHENDDGENVYAAVTDYQSYDHGFTGLFRQFHFIPGGGEDAPDRIQAKTYSHHPEERGYRQDVINDGVDCEWHWDLDFDERFPSDGGGGEQTPYNGPHSVPGTIEAEHFDTGGEGVAYHDTTDDHYGADYRSGEAVDIKSSTENDYAVGWIEAGEWLEYTVEVDSDGEYDVAARVASAADGGSLSVSADGGSVSASFDETGGWDTWTTVDLGTLSLTAGETTIRVEATDSNWNLNYLEFEPVPTEGVNVIDDSSIRAILKPDFDVRWPDNVYFGSSVNGAPLEWKLMDETSDNVFETTLGGLSAGDDLVYQFVYYNGNWEYTERGSTTFRPEDDGSDDDGESGPGTNRLVDGSGDQLLPGEFLESTNGDYRLYLQDDGNLVLRDTNTWDALWASGTAGDGGTRLQLQGDGNLVIYTDGGDPVWASDTAGSGGDELTLEDDGTLVLSADASDVWTANE